MSAKRQRTAWLIVLVLAGLCPTAANAQLIISGNELKIDLNPGLPTVVPNAGPDSLSLLDFSVFPPKVRHLSGIPNTVIGPPSNIAITPNGQLALIASSLKVEAGAKLTGVPPGTVPDATVFVLDLTVDPPKVIGEAKTGRQPSGISITPDGKRALVANRNGGSVTVLNIAGKSVTTGETLELAKPEDQVSDVAISPDGKLALVSVTEAGYLAVVDLTDGIKLTPRKLGVFGRPYRCVITPDGALGITAGTGRGETPDTDAISIVDLKAKPMQVVDHVPIGSGPESFEISPDGKLIAAVLMNGSNLAADAPQRTQEALITLLARRGNTYVRVQQLPTGRIPEGVAFTSDGKYLVVQCHPDQQLRIYKVNGEKIEDTGERVAVPGRPSALRAAIPGR